MNVGTVPMPVRAQFRVLTPAGRGAVAVVGVRGTDARDLVDAVFRPASGGGLGSAPTDRIRFGRLGAGAGDEVVVLVGPGAPPVVEIHCHGGVAAVDLIVAALQTQGAVAASWDDWIGRGAPSREAARWLPCAPTLRGAEILLDQAAGALDVELARLARTIRDHPQEARQDLDGLIRRSEIGRKLISGWLVALAGPPNVGKSRLLNRLAGFDRAIVDPTPGTTRDVVRLRTAFEGWPVELADTAGLREADHPVEASGVALAQSLHREADLVVLVLDVAEPWTAREHRLRAEYPDALVLANKVDLPTAWSAQEWGALPVSAATGEGIPELIAAVARRLVPEPPTAGAPIPWLAAHARRLGAARRLLKQGQLDRAARLLDAWSSRGSGQDQRQV